MKAGFAEVFDKYPYIFGGILAFPYIFFLETEILLYSPDNDTQVINADKRTYCLKSNVQREKMKNKCFLIREVTIEDERFTNGAQDGNIDVRATCYSFVTSLLSALVHTHCLNQYSNCYNNILVKWILIKILHTLLKKYLV